MIFPSSTCSFHHSNILLVHVHVLRVATLKGVGSQLPRGRGGQMSLPLPPPKWNPEGRQHSVYIQCPQSQKWSLSMSKVTNLSLILLSQRWTWQCSTASKAQIGWIVHVHVSGVQCTAQAGYTVVSRVSAHGRFTILRCIPWIKIPYVCNRCCHIAPLKWGTWWSGHSPETLRYYINRHLTSHTCQVVHSL